MELLYETNTIYYNSLVMSNKLAQKYGPYETFGGSHTSHGRLQFDLWNVKPELYSENVWGELKTQIIKTHS